MVVGATPEEQLRKTDNFPRQPGFAHTTRAGKNKVFKPLVFEFRWKLWLVRVNPSSHSRFKILGIFCVGKSESESVGPSLYKVSHTQLCDGDVR